jgi:Lon protease-like protein
VAQTAVLFEFPPNEAKLTAMEMEIVVPDEVPVMTLPNLAFFPQALLPLHIFEPRYRHMLRDVLASNRLFAVAGLDVIKLGTTQDFEPPCRVASVGIIRACQENENGTSNLLLQGLCRVEAVSIISEEPYRRMQIRTLASASGGTMDDNLRLRSDLIRLIGLKRKYGGVVPEEMTDFLRTVEDPETFVDLAAFSLCEDGAMKQKLLETLDVQKRLKLFGTHLRAEIDAIRLRTKLQGKLPDDHIANN